ncbi:autotransporter outer membrane beta-barrel domain-containing protein [Aminobacter sp. J44]|uniref:autotransporter family protein n=1 Tax=Aminobacter sp. J44 TaxID=935262 RepID=UPI00119AC71F|nr:autotransporter outer membrane beta-barrel domain-containing protein [Aminobacter sp. J44]TWG65513.1 fibronectin-binding autotransporter adhesin [Aminobacter sp. J44]
MNNGSSSANATIDINEAGSVWVRGEQSYGAWSYNLGSGEARVTNLGSVLATGSQSGGLTSFATVGDAIVTNFSSVTASGEYGTGIIVDSVSGAASVEIASGATVTGGWQADATGAGPSSNRPSSGVLLRSMASTLTNAGTITAASDRAIADVGRWEAARGAVATTNGGTVTGFLELAAVAGNSFANTAGGLFDVRHFADTDGDGTRDTKRVAISDFGAASSSFDNQAGALVRLAPVSGNAATDPAGYYVPTTGAGNTPLEASYYNLSRNGIVQGQFTNLGAFSHSGVIDLRGPQTGNTLVMTSNATAGGAAGTGVFTSNGGTLLLNTVLNEGVAAGGGSGSYSDVLVVDATSLGSAPTTIVIDRREGAGAQTVDNGILLVEVRNAAASAPGVFTLQGDYAVDGEQRILAGLYSYALYHHGIGGAADGNWYLRNVAFTPTVPVYQEYPKVLVPLVDLPTRQQRVGNRHWRDPADVAPAETVFCKDASQNFRCTVTEEQASYYVGNDGSVVLETNGIWGRIEGARGHYEAASATAEAEYDETLWRLQAGIDGLLHESDKGRLIAGLSVHYGQVNGDIASASGLGEIDAQGYGVGGSLTWYGMNGFYVDAQAQVSWLNSDISSTTLGTVLADGNDGLGYALGIEAGYKFALNETWSLTPQAQLVYSRIDFDDFTDPFGATVALRDGDSLRARVGLAAEYETRWTAANGTKSRASLYGIANLYHEFLDGYRVAIADGEVTSRNDRLWGGIGVGGTLNWNDDRFSVYGEASVATSLEHFGDSHSVAGTIGLRVKW